MIRSGDCYNVVRLDNAASSIENFLRRKMVFVTFMSMTTVGQLYLLKLMYGLVEILKF